MASRLATKGDRDEAVAPREQPVAPEVPAAGAAPSPWPGRLVAAATAGFVLLFSILVLYKHAHLGTRAFDLAIFDQGLWLLSQGETPFVTVRGLHLFADHSSFLMIPLVPLYWVWADVRVLLILTVLAMAAGGPLVYAAAKAEGVGRWPAAGLGVGFLLLPAVQWQVWDVFHPETLAIPLLIAAYLLALRHRPWWSFALLVLVLLAKEDAALVVLPLAIYLGIRFRQRWLGIGGAVAAAAALVVNFVILLPHYSPTGELIYSGRYEEFGDGIFDIMWGALTAPGEIVGAAFSGDRPLYIIGLVLPFLASLAAPEILLIAVPTLVANLLSAHRYQAELQYHYTAYIISVVAIAAVVGTRRLLRLRGNAPGWRRSVVAVGLVAALTGALFGPWGLWVRNPWAGHAARSELVTEAVALVPPDAAVSADSRIVPHLAHRETVYFFPNPVVPRDWSTAGLNPPSADDFDWLLVRADLEGMDEVFLAALDKLTSDGTFVEVLANDEVTVLQRASSQ